MGLLHIFLAFVLVLLSCGPASSIEDERFIAVYMNPGFYEQYWDHERLSYYETGKTWGSFDGFCRRAAHLAKGRPVVLDLDVHGNDGGLFLDYSEVVKGKQVFRTYRASFGFIVNCIERNFAPGQVTLMTEACYSGRAYYYTMRNNPLDMTLGCRIENHKDVPKFPIIGVGSITSNYGNLIFLEFIDPLHKLRSEDLRQYEFRKPGPKYRSQSPQDRAVYADYLFMRHITHRYY